jgi:hypothetical protein
MFIRFIKFDLDTILIFCRSLRPTDSGVHWLWDMIGNTDQNNQV